MLLTLTFASLFTIGDPSTVDLALDPAQVRQPPVGYRLERETPVDNGSIFRFRRIYEGLVVLDHELIRRWDEDRGLIYQKIAKPIREVLSIARFQVTRDEALAYAVARGPKFPHLDPMQPGKWSACLM